METDRRIQQFRDELEESDRQMFGPLLSPEPSKSKPIPKLEPKPTVTQQIPIKRNYYAPIDELAIACACMFLSLAFTHSLLLISCSGIAIVAFLFPPGLFNYLTTEPKGWRHTPPIFNVWNGLAALFSCIGAVIISLSVSNNLEWSLYTLAVYVTLRYIFKGFFNYLNPSTVS